MSSTKKSMNGTTCMKELERTPRLHPPPTSQAADITAILETCLKTGVTSLKWRDLEVSFFVPGQPVMAYDLPKTTFDGYAPQASEQELSRDSAIGTVDKELLDDMRRSQLLIDDPLGFEQEIIDAHMQRGE